MQETPEGVLEVPQNMVLVPCEVSWDCVCFQQLLKDPKVSLAVLNPYIKRSIKVKSLKDITTKEKFSPLTANLMSECWGPSGLFLNPCVGI